MPICAICKEDSSTESFSWRNKSKGIRHKHCKNCQRSVAKRHYENNKQNYIDSANAWAANNKQRARANKHDSYARLKGYPSCDCCTQEEIKEYIKQCPKGHHVDHIKCSWEEGKHCLKNLQFLPSSHHCRKSSKDGQRKRLI